MCLTGMRFDMGKTSGEGAGSHSNRKAINTVSKHPPRLTYSNNKLRVTKTGGKKEVILKNCSFVI